MGRSLGGASHTTVGRYLDTLVDTLMVRRLEPYLANVAKRLVKSPKCSIWIAAAALGLSLSTVLRPLRPRDLSIAGHARAMRDDLVEGFALDPNCAVVIHNPVDRQRILEACSTAPPLPVRRRTRNIWLQCAEIGSHIRRTLRGE